MANSSTLQDTLPANICGWNNEGGIYVYKLSVDTASSALTIRAVAPQAGHRQIIVGWSHSADFDHELTFNLGNSWTPEEHITANTRYGVPIGAHVMWPGYPDHQITITTDVATTSWTGMCAIVEVSQLHFS
jgi:hypothetical protein